MTNLRFNFENPLLLLLLVPALAMTLIPYFRMNRKYRGTRNRITSMITHTIIMVLCTLVLSGFNVTYDVPNTKNEVLLLVDTSFSGKENEAQKNAFVEAVINSTDSKFKVGVVTFGYDQVYAVEMTNEREGIYESYLQSFQQQRPNPDLEASDIASALKFASTLFTNPQTSRIVLLSDGAETDNEASKVIRAIAAQGIKVDTVHFPNEEVTNEVQLLGVVTPSQSIRVGETFALELTLQSEFETKQAIQVQLYDNDEESTSQIIELAGGVQTVQIETSLNVPGMHKLAFEIVEYGEDTSGLNNVLNSYMYLEIFDKVLIIENNSGEADALAEMLSETMNVGVVNIHDVEAMPKTVDDLRAYDEVVLCNIANNDMPEGFDKILHNYVYDVGGGLFTVAGGASGTGGADNKANAYTREDMYGTLYQNMLPVEIINYTPPLAVVIIVDRSGSMWNAGDGTTYEQSKLYAAKQGAEACLDVLSDRDYVGILALSDYYEESVKLTPRPQRAKILAAIDSIELGGGTIYEGALEGARQALLSNTKVEKRHIILVSDGLPGDTDPESYLNEARKNAAAGITMSVVGIECDNSAKRALIELVEAGGGDSSCYYDIKDVLNVATSMREDLQAPEIKDVNYEPFTPTITTTNSVVNNVRQEDLGVLDGFYGSKLKNGATEILGGEYVPIYAQWEYGKGMVGSFMCDLSGVWSSGFVNNPTTTVLMNNIVTALFPSENIRPSDIRTEIYEDNYHNTLSVFTSLLEGQKIRVTVTSPSLDGISDPTSVVYYPEEGSGQTRVNFTATVPGQHKILIEKVNEDGTVASQRTIYKSFSYTEEYNEFTDYQACADLMAKLAEAGEGAVIAKDNPWGVFDNLEKYLHVLINPRVAFLIISLVLFLVDIAVRKFKWKWIHEVMRERKIKNALQAK